MELSPAIIVLVLLAAALHAVWNALVKSGGDPLVVLASVNFTGLLAGALLALVVAAPAPASWLYIFLSTVLHSGYYYFLLQAYRSGDLSRVYPLARGAAPLMVVAGAAVFADEHLPPLALAGVLLACAGIISLAFERGRPWRHDARPVLFALGTGVWIAGYTVVDGIGVRLSESPLGYIAWLFFFDAWPIAIVAVVLRRRRLVTYLGREWRRCVGGGVAAITAYGVVIYAMSVGAMGAVSALRETSVVMAALIGTLLLKERFGRRRVLSALVVAAAVAVMHLA